MTEALYERYKEALRRGHVAALRGRFDAALVAYGEAAEIAPERSLPHTSLGGVLTRVGRHDDALRAYGTALDRAPRDEAALIGRVEVLVTLGRRVDAADGLDLLAEIQESAGRTAEACDTARRALELAESRARRRLVGRLVDELRGRDGDEAAQAALSRAMQALEAVGATGTLREDAPAPALARPPPEPEPEPDLGPELTAQAESLVAADDSEALELCLAAAEAHRRVGRTNAAIDACYLGLAVAPDHPSIHLLLAELYVERGWQGQAAEKLVLLARLADLDDDRIARERLCALVAARFADDARLTAICA
jgi:tetratricopeptide (TPR) repeat protein